MTSTDWLTLILVLVTIYYAYQTRWTVKKMDEANENSTRPLVVAYVRSTEASQNLIELVIKNEGNGPARNITFEISGDDLELNLQSTKIKKISELLIIKKGIKLLGTKEEREYYLLSLVGIYEKILSKRTTIKVTYTTADISKKYTDSFELDFSSLSDSRWRSDEMKANSVVAKELPKIRLTLEKMIKK